MSTKPPETRTAHTIWRDQAKKICTSCPHSTVEGRKIECSLIPQKEPGHKPCNLGYFHRKGRECFDDPPRYRERTEYIHFPKFHWNVPGGRRAVCTIIIGAAAEELARYTLPRIRTYAERVDADLIIIDEDQFPYWPMANKFNIGSVVREYERTYYVDIDVWIRDKCPDVFELFDGEKIWLHRDADYLTKGFLEEDSRLLSRPEVHLDCWNTGIALMSQKHHTVWTPPTTLTAPSHTAEQSSVEIRIKDEGHEIGAWSPIWNNQYWTNRVFWDHFPHANVLHLSGVQNPTRIPILKRLVEEEGIC